MIVIIIIIFIFIFIFIVIVIFIFIFIFIIIIITIIITIIIMRRANIKVSSTETGAIFGNIVYESTAYADRSVVVLNDIHIDIMDYISPASCPDVQFRSMWAEFEWENKVSHS